MKIIIKKEYFDKFENSKYHEKALSLLHNQLSDCPWNIDEETKEIDKKLLIKMFKESCKIIQRNENNQNAEYVFYSCIRTVRCICIDDVESCKILLQNKVYTLDALEQYENALRHYEFIV